jgi:hypothetical protein
VKGLPQPGELWGLPRHIKSWMVVVRLTKNHVVYRPYGSEDFFCLPHEVWCKTLPVLQSRVISPAHSVTRN